MKVREIMTKNPVVVKLPGRRDDAIKLLVKHKKTGLPVVNGNDNSYVGFVTRQHIFAKPFEDQLALIMQKDFPTITPTVDIKEAVKILLNHNIYHLPVVDEKKGLVGIVTPADFLILIEKKSIKTEVGKFIKSPCVPIYEGTPLRVAAAIIGISGVYAFPVLNDKGRLSGIITDRDIFILSKIEGRLRKTDLGSGSDEDIWTWEGIRNVMKYYYEVSRINLPHKKVKDVMVKKVVSVFQKTPVMIAARLMRKNDFGQLPVRDENDKLLGIVYDLDVIRALLE